MFPVRLGSHKLEPKEAANGLYSAVVCISYEFRSLICSDVTCCSLVSGTDRMSRNVGNYQLTLRNMPEE